MLSYVFTTDQPKFTERQSFRLFYFGLMILIALGINVYYAFTNLDFLISMNIANGIILLFSAIFHFILMKPLAKIRLPSKLSETYTEHFIFVAFGFLFYILYILIFHNSAFSWTFVGIQIINLLFVLSLIYNIAVGFYLMHGINWFLVDIFSQIVSVYIMYFLFDIFANIFLKIAFIVISYALMIVIIKYKKIYN